MKNYTVLNRFQLKPNSLAKMKELLDDWKTFLKKHAPECDMEIVALNDDYACWMELWETRQALDAFQQNHLSMSSHLSRCVELSYPNSEREIFKRVK